MNAEQKGIDKDEKEEIYNEIDEIEKSVIEIIEVTQNEILPEAFAVIKETATRFKNNATIKVTASDFDKDLAANKDFVNIEGKHAIYKNSWIAAGNEIMYANAIKGFVGSSGVMPGKGGNPTLSDAEVKAAVDHMVSKSQ